MRTGVYDAVMSSNSDEFLVVGAKSFGIAIREFRRRHHLSQQEVAARADMHRSYLAGLESGSTTDAVQQIMRALAALNLEVVIRQRRPP